MVWKKEEYNYLSEREQNGQLDELKGIRILMAEDDEIAMDNFDNQMKKYHINVDKTYDGYEVADIFSQSTENYYDIIFMDSIMPGKNGMQVVVAEIRGMNRKDSKSIPIIMVSAYMDHNITIEAYKNGITDYIQKPFKIDTVVKILKHYVGDRNATKAEKMVK